MRYHYNEQEKVFCHTYMCIYYGIESRSMRYSKTSVGAMPFAHNVNLVYQCEYAKRRGRKRVTLHHAQHRLAHSATHTYMLTQITFAKREQKCHLKKYDYTFSLNEYACLVFYLRSSFFFLFEEIFSWCEQIKQQSRLEPCLLNIKTVRLR